jgi:hypothetical protein
VSSLKKLKKDLPEHSEILSVTRRESSLPLSKKKYSDLTEVTRRFVEAENFFLKNFAGFEGLQYLKYPKELRNEYVRHGLPPELLRLGLQARQWKLALDVAFDTIKSSHALTREKVKKSVQRSGLLWNETEKHLIRALLLRPDLLYWICLGRFKEIIPVIENFDFWKANSHGKTRSSKKVLIWLRRRYRECHHRKAEMKKFRTYHVDQNMFSFFQEKGTCYFAVASLVPNQRIVIPLTNSSLKAEDFSGNVKVVLKKNRRVEIHRAIHTVVPQCPLTKEDVQKKAQIAHSEAPLKIIGLDKGLKTLLHTDRGTSYGQDYSQKFIQWSDQLTQVNSGRARFYSLERILKKDLRRTKNPQTRRKLQKKLTRIQENNLGDQKVTRLYIV